MNILRIHIQPVLVYIGSLINSYLVNTHNVLEFMQNTFKYDIMTDALTKLKKTPFTLINLNCFLFSLQKCSGRGTTFCEILSCTWQKPMGKIDINFYSLFYLRFFLALSLSLISTNILLGLSFKFCVVWYCIRLLFSSSRSMCWCYILAFLYCSIHSPYTWLNVIIYLVVFLLEFWCAVPVRHF